MRIPDPDLLSVIELGLRDGRADLARRAGRCEALAALYGLAVEATVRERRAVDRVDIVRGLDEEGRARVSSLFNLAGQDLDELEGTRTVSDALDPDEQEAIAAWMD